MDRIGWQDIQKAKTPNIDYLIQNGAIGLMTTNTGGSLNQPNAYLTLGAGARVVASSESSLSFSAGDEYQGKKVGDIYFQRTGARVEDDSIVNIATAQIIRNNKNKPYTVNIGALGTALRKAGRIPVVLGNCDTDREYQRYLPTMLMDEKGVVPAGDVGRGLLVEDVAKPYGLKTDYEKMLQRLYDFWDRCDVIAVQLGDTSRVEDFKYEATDERIEILRQEAIEEGDAFIGRLIEKMDRNKDLLLFLSPVGPAKELELNNRLSPIIAFGKGIEKGWLSSGSTHRDGVVNNLDVGATILDFFDIRPEPGQTGAPIFSRGNNKGFDGLLAFNKRLVEIYNQRYFLIRSYVFLQIILLGLTLVSLLFARRYLKYMKAALLFLMIVPLLYLIITIFHRPILMENVAILLVLGTALTAILMALAPKVLDRIVFICGILSLALLVDQWTGARLIQGSPLGYDVISGARFYGIGNEYMGILMGAVCTTAAAAAEKWADRQRKILLLLALFLAGALITMVLPQLGANVGGGIAAFIAFALTWMLLKGRKVTIRHGFIIGGALISMLVILFVIDSFRALDSQSHMGQTAKLLQQNGIGELFKIFERKISMNIKLFRYTIWTRVLLTCIFVVAVLFYRPLGILKDVVSRHRNLSKGLIGGTVGSIAALLANDSGVVAAATSMVYVIPPLLLITIEFVEEKVRRGEWNDGIHKKSESA